MPIFYVITILCMIFLMFMFAACTMPFILGRYDDELWCSILNLAHNSSIVFFLTLDPLSMMILLGTPYIHIMLFFRKRATILLVTLVYDTASTHLVK